MPEVQRPTGRDVTKRNFPELIYIKGDGDTDGSIRFQPDPIDTANAEIEYRTSGVWNTTGLDISGNTLWLGREMRISAFGEFIQGFDDFEDLLQIHPHIHYNNDGTSEGGYMPHLDPREQNTVQSDFSSEIIGSLLTFQTIPLPDTRITDEIIIRVGSVAPTGNVLVEGWRDAIGGTLPVMRTTYPAAALDQPEGTEIEVLLPNAIQFGNVGTYIRLTVDDDSDMSLQSDSGGIPWMALRSWPLSDDAVITAPLVSKFITTITSDTIADNNGNLVLAGIEL